MKNDSNISEVNAEDKTTQERPEYPFVRLEIVSNESAMDLKLELQTRDTQKTAPRTGQLTLIGHILKSYVGRLIRDKDFCDKQAAKYTRISEYVDSLNKEISELSEAHNLGNSEFKDESEVDGL